MENSQIERREKFRYLTLRLTKAAADCGFQLTPYFDTNLVYFCRLSEGAQERAIVSLDRLSSQYESLYAHDHKRPSVALQLAFFLKQNKITTDPAVVERISEDEGVDIYDENHSFLFASLNILHLLTYSIEDLYCRPWYELFRRDTPGVQEKLLAVCLDLAAGKHTKLVDVSYIENNISSETSSVAKRAVACIPRYFAPIFRDGKPAGYLCVNLFSEIEQAPEDD